MEQDILAHPSFEGKIVFGPVRSRRLGASLGVSNVKHKLCDYNCVYCQAGETTCCSKERDCCLSPYELYFFVKNKIETLERSSIHLDYISFVPNGEPTLDDQLATEISLLREFGYPIAVFTNGSLMWNDRVKEALMCADHVSVKLDSVNEETWRKIDRPHRKLRFDLLLEGIGDFSRAYRGVLTTETMLVRGMNDTIGEMEQLGNFLTTINRSRSYFVTPFRPPCEAYAVPPARETLDLIARYVNEHIPDSEMLCCPDRDEFTALGDVEEELLGIMSVQPLAEESVDTYLSRHTGSHLSINRLIDRGLVHRTTFQNRTFYVRHHQ